MAGWLSLAVFAFYMPVSVTSLTAHGATKPETPSSLKDEWMASDEYQRSFEQRVAKNLFPLSVEGRAHDNTDQFRATWAEAPPGCEFYSYNQLNERAYADFNRTYSGQGFTITSLKRFTASDGINKYQAVWSKSCSGSLQSKGNSRRIQKSTETEASNAGEWYAQGEAAYDKDDYGTALACFQKALRIYGAAKNREAEASTLHYIGGSLYGQNRDDEALNYYQRALLIWRDIKDRSGEERTLANIADVYDRKGQYDEAVKYYQKALLICREIRDRSEEARALSGIGDAYNEKDQYADALKSYQEALPIWRELKNRTEEAQTLNDIGDVYDSESRYEKALDSYQQALPIWRELEDRENEASALSSIGKDCFALGRHDAALDYYQRALAIQRTLQDRGAEAETLTGIGLFFSSRGRYEEALKSYLQALEIQRAIPDQGGEAATLNQLGLTYLALGRAEDALKNFEKVVRSAQQLKDRKAELAGLDSLSFAYLALNRDTDALNALQRALVIQRDVKNRLGEALTLISVATVHLKLERFSEALTDATKTLQISRDMKMRDGEAFALAASGFAYDGLRQHDAALKSFQQALVIQRELQYRPGEVATLAGLMSRWKNQGERRLAIFYGKQAVNSIQELRGNIRGLSDALQKSFIRSAGDIYRQLIDVLSDEGRLPEAEQVLALLKEEEYFEFVQEDANEARSLTNVAALTPRETEWDTRYRDLASRIATISGRRGSLRAEKSLGPDEQRQLATLDTEFETTVQDFRTFHNNLEKEFTAEQASSDLRDTVGQQQALRADLPDFGSGTVAVLTVTEKEKYRVILVTSQGEKTREYPIKAADLNRKVQSFREVLLDVERDPLPIAQELYTILVGPIAKDLKDANAKTIMWSLDGTLRYIPVAALHDGRNYLAEEYRHVVFTFANRMRLKDAVSAKWNALGLGVSKQLGGFRPMPNVVSELRGIIRDQAAEQIAGILPGVVKLDEDFTEDSMIAGLHQGYALVHIASHFQFEPANENSSFLLLGDGRHLTLDRIRNLRNLFAGTELLTLSACNTATNGASGSGREVEGFALIAQNQGAKAVIATLWPVIDESTTVLFHKFYRLRETMPGILKCEALRQAQLDLLHGQRMSSDSDRTSAAPSPKSRASKGRLSPNPNAPYAHPYYWAPFTLIGNWK